MGVATTGYMQASHPSTRSEIIPFVCRSCPVMEKTTSLGASLARQRADTAESENLSMRGNFKRENREILLVSANRVACHRPAERSENVTDGNADMNVNRKSDESVVPATPANNGATETPAESAEERDSAKRNAEQAALHRTQSRNQRKPRGLLGVREAARKDGKLKFTALLHHVDEDCLTEAFFNLKKTAAVGVDGVTWHEYERNLEANIADLHGRIHRGAYRAKPSRRPWIPKADGRQRPLGIASLASYCASYDRLLG